VHTVVFPDGRPALPPIGARRRAASPLSVAALGLAAGIVLAIVVSPVWVW
jgi:hypothetical protein